MELLRIILQLATAISAANALKCYECQSDIDEDCYDIPKGQTKHLTVCPTDKPYICVFTEFPSQSELGTPVQERECSPKLICSFNMNRPRCCRCTTDACNDGYYCTYDSGAITKLLHCVIIAALIVSISM